MGTGVMFGAYVAAASIILSLVLYATGAEFDSGLGNAVYYLNLIVIPAAGVFMGIKTRRDQELEGEIAFGKAFSTGMTVVVIASLILAVYNYVFLSFIAPELVDKIAETSARKMAENPDFSAEQREQSLAMMKSWMTPPMMALWGLAFALFLGALYALVSAAILRTRAPRDVVASA